MFIKSRNLSVDKHHDLTRLGMLSDVASLRHRGQDNFSMVRGVSADGPVLLGDPIWGNQKFEARRSRTMWKTDGDAGKVLAILPGDNVQSTNVKRGFFHASKPNTLATRHLMLRSNPHYQYCNPQGRRLQ